MKNKSIIIFLFLLSLTIKAQNLNSVQLDSLYNQFLQVRSHTAAVHHAGIQSINIPHIKCGFGIVSSIRSNFSHFTPAQRLRLKSLLDRPVTDTSIVSPGGFFRVHFTKADTPNYIPDDIRMTITSSSEMQLLQKEYLDSLTIALDSAYNFEINYLGYPPPPSDNGTGGDNKYDIYISSLGNEYGETDPDSEVEPGSGTFTSYMLINGDYSGFFTNGINAARVTVAHEFHHSIQIGNYIYRYDLDGFFYELTSVSMEHFVYPTIRDYLQYLPSYFYNTQNSLGLNGTLQEYALAIWNIFLKDNFGFDIIKKQWQLMPQLRALQAIANSFTDYNTSFRKPPVVDRPTAQHEWLADDQLHFRQGFSRPFEQRLQIPFVNLHRALVTELGIERVPEVVHADQNAQQVGFQVEAIRLPALGQLKHLVAADTAIEDLQRVVGPGHQQFRRRQPRVAVAQSGLVVGCGHLRWVATSTRVGDRIPLKENHVAPGDKVATAGRPRFGGLGGQRQTGQTGRAQRGPGSLQKTSAAKIAHSSRMVAHNSGLKVASRMRGGNLELLPLGRFRSLPLDSPPPPPSRIFSLRHLPEVINTRRPAWEQDGTRPGGRSCWTWGLGMRYFQPL